MVPPPPPRFFGHHAIILCVLLWLILSPYIGAASIRLETALAEGPTVSIPLARQPTTAQYKVILEHFEGVRYRVYGRGPKEPYVVGIGHNLTPAERRAHPSLVYTRTEIDAFFYADLSRAIGACRRFFKTFDEQPAPVQIALVNIAYCVGPTGLKDWKDLKLGIDNYLYEIAYNAVGNSQWYWDVQPSRANWVAQTIRRGGQPIQVVRMPR